MEDKKIENLIPELADEALDRAAGGSGGRDVRYCSRCRRNKLYTWGERETGICSECWDNPYDDGDHDSILGDRP